MTAPQPQPLRDSPKRVLFLSGLQLHPTLSGGQLRSFGLATALRQHGLDVFVYSFVGRKADYLARRPSSIQQWPEGIEEFVDRGLLGFVAQFGSYRLALPPLWLTAALRVAAAFPGGALLPALLRRQLAWCDAIVADFPFVHPVFAAPQARGRLRVLSTHNLEHQVFSTRSWLGAAVRRTELAAARSCDVLVACCEEDLRFFQASTELRNVVLVPNGIDPRRFEGLEAQRAPVRRALGVDDGERVFLFTASKYAPNREAFEFLRRFAAAQAPLLREQKIRILVVGNVTAETIRLPGFTATGPVERVEPYFAAADAALNPLASGAGTNVKMGEFLAARLPILSTRFGARGFALADGETALLFEREGLADTLAAARSLFDRDPGRLRGMAARAYTRNASAVDMFSCARPLAQAIRERCA